MRRRAEGLRSARLNRSRARSGNPPPSHHAVSQVPESPPADGPESELVSPAFVRERVRLRTPVKISRKLYLPSGPFLS
jgi:hypothetical protein